MKPTIESGTHLAESADLSGSHFMDVNLEDAVFENVNLSRARFQNINFSDIIVSAGQIGGADFKHIGLPTSAASAEIRQRPLRFDQCDLNGTTFSNCDLREVEIVGCDVSGMRIDGISVESLLEAYEQPDG